MKTKIITLLAVSALVTLSFTIISVKQAETKTEPAGATNSSVQNEPIGGFASEDKY